MKTDCSKDTVFLKHTLESLHQLFEISPFCEEISPNARILIRQPYKGFYHVIIKEDCHYYLYTINPDTGCKTKTTKLHINTPISMAYSEKKNSVYILGHSKNAESCEEGFCPYMILVVSLEHNCKQKKFSVYGPDFMGSLVGLAVDDCGEVYLVDSANIYHVKSSGKYEMVGTHGLANAKVATFGPKPEVPSGTTTLDHLFVSDGAVLRSFDKADCFKMSSEIHLAEIYGDILDVEYDRYNDYMVLLVKPCSGKYAIYKLDYRNGTNAHLFDVSCHDTVALSVQNGAFRLCQMKVSDLVSQL